MRGLLPSRKARYLPVLLGAVLVMVYASCAYAGAIPVQPESQGHVPGATVSPDDMPSFGTATQPRNHLPGSNNDSARLFGRIDDADYLRALNIVESATQTAVKIIQLSAYVVAAALFVFTIISGAFTFYYREQIKRRAEEFRVVVEQARSTNQEMNDRLTQYDAMFSEYMSELKKMPLLAGEARQKLLVLSNPDASADDLIAAITYLGERGNAKHIQYILQAARRFPDDQELWKFAIDAVLKLSGAEQPQDTDSD